jgi:DNA-binding transcriptional LysR family regulator
VILNMNQLRAFYAAAKTGSIKKAAQGLMVTPPAITMQVKQLERTVGIRLLFRDGNSVRLTDIGEAVFTKAENIFGKIHGMENFFEDISTGKSGELRIGCTQTSARYLMPRLLAAFKDAYPGIRIVLDQGSNAEMVRSILDHKNELALIRNVPDDKRLKIKVIGRVEVVLTTARRSTYFPREETSVSELSKVPLIVSEEGSATRDVTFEYLRKFKVTTSVAVESASLDLIKELVRQDRGVSFLARYEVEELAEESLKEVRILEGTPTMEFGVGYLNRKNLSPAAWAFLRLVDKSEILLPFLKLSTKD